MQAHNRGVRVRLRNVGKVRGNLAYTLDAYPRVPHNGYMNTQTFAKGEPVRFMGERYRVVRMVHGGRDVVLQNVFGTRLTVTPVTVERGWWG